MADTNGKKHKVNPKLKQPYLIQLKTGEPCFFAAIGKFQRDGGFEPKEDDGFVIITSSSGAGMLDIHDRRPLVLSPECAAHWLDPELPPYEAEEVAIKHGLGAPTTAFSCGRIAGKGVSSGKA